MSGVEIETMIEDAGKLMKNEKNRKTKNLPAAEMAFDEYLDYDELEEWLLSISEKYSHLTQIKEVGKTEDGNRSIWGLHIGDNNNDSEKKKIFMECGIHAREWVSPATCRYFINEVLNAANDPDYTVNDSLPYDSD